jgi:hypothetical protein
MLLGHGHTVYLTQKPLTELKTKQWLKLASNVATCNAYHIAESFSQHHGVKCQHSLLLSVMMHLALKWIQIRNPLSKPLATK